MPRRLKTQRRGAGKTKYVSKGHRFLADTRYAPVSDAEVTFAKISSIEHDRGRTAPVISVLYENGKKIYLPAPEGIKEGQVIAEGISAPVSSGNIIPLAAIPEGTVISNVEKRPGDGGSLIRSSGSAARVVAHENERVLVMLPSRKLLRLDPRCRATVGRIAGGGRTEKPFVKAGKKHHAVKVRSKIWPVVSAGAMNSLDHPLGGGRGRHGKHLVTGRKKPRGRRVGTIAPSRTGRKKK